MTSKFKFKDNGTVLDFGNAKFTVDISNPELIEEVLQFAETAEEKAEKLKSEDDYIKGLREIISFCIEAIDKILGEGASEKIFEGRTVSMLDAIQVIDYIVEEVKKGKTTQFDKYSPDRTKRK